MKPRSQAATEDGFETNVAQKMPRMRKLEEPHTLHLEQEPQPQEKEDDQTLIDEILIPKTNSPEKQTERKVILESLQKGNETEQRLDVLTLIEDLHAQLLASAQTKRALEMDLVSYKKSIHQLAQDNQELRRQWEALSKEDEKLRELQSESIYLQEEHGDALEKIKEFQQELREMKNALTKATQEREEAFDRIRDLESQIEQSEVMKIKGRLKEREASLFSEENRELQSKLEETLARNADLERKYETLKKSFSEVRESLTFLRDSCKANYYNLSESAE
jgi:DNA repair exonuclease SbcCD ATPase subunit